MLPRMSVCLIAAVCTAALVAQSSPSATAAPVAYAFVSSEGPDACTQTTCGPTAPYNLYSLAVSSSGALSQVSVTTSPTAILHLSVTKKFLFGIDDEATIYTYSISSSGALKLVATTDAGKDIPGFSSKTPGSEVLQVDEAGSTVYTIQGNSDESEFYLASFKIESSGALQFLGTSYADPHGASQLRFSQGGKYALTAVCYNTAAGASFTTDSDDVNDIITYKRESNGFLTYQGTSHDTPTAKSPYEYCAGPVANDSSDHLAIAFSIFNPPGDDVEPGFPLGTYTVNSSGDVSTSSDYENMPAPNLDGYLKFITIDPTGKLLALAGDLDLQFFHFNGASPITTYSSAIKTGSYPLMALGWDTSSHFFALSQGGVYAYKITPSSYTKLAGWNSPNAQKDILESMIVLSE